MIRDAVPADIPDIVRLGRAFFEESGWQERLAGIPDSDFCPETFAETATALGKNFVLLVYEKNGAVVGMIGVPYAPAIFNKKLLIAGEIFWYVDASYRKGAGAELLRQLESALRARNVKLLGMVSEHGLRHEALAQVYKRAGFTLAEYTFYKAL